MADILMVCIREEDKDDFIVEFIKGLISGGLTISYAGTFYSERKDQYVYDTMTNLQFFASTYFREAQMKSKDFRTWEDFVANIDFDQIDARLVIYVITCTRKIDTEKLRKAFRESFFLERLFANVAVELIKNTFEMSFFDFKAQYPELSKIFRINEKFLDKLKERVRDGRVGARIKWDGDDGEAFHTFHRFIRKLLQRERELKEDRPREETLQELEQLQKEVELECSKDPSKGEQLALDFFGSNVIEEVLELAERTEIVFYFDIRKKIPTENILRENILCIYYEEEISGEKANLDIYSEKSIQEKEENNANETEDEENNANETEVSRRIPIPHPHEPHKIKRTRRKLVPPRQLYDAETIRYIIDDYVVLALHPPLVHVYFPTNDFLLEIDPEEPEIGFLSRKIDLRNCKTLEERLRINARLREELLVYKLNEKGRKFRLVNIGDRKESEEEEIVILGRIRDLYRVFIANKEYGRFYQLFHSAVKFLTPLTIVLLFLMILLFYSLDSSKATKEFVKAVFVLFGVAFAFWASKNFVLSYILEPTYRTFKLVSYVVLSTILFLHIILSIMFSLNIEYSGILSILFETLNIFFSILLEYLGTFGIFFLILAFLIGICLLRSYIRSAIFHQLNNLFEIIDYNDVIEIENPNIQSGVEKIECLKCEQFQTIVIKNTNIEVFFNSSLFPIIKSVRKKIRTHPEKFAYSSGIFLSSSNEEELRKDEEPVVELLYRKPEAWRFWKKLENFLFGKEMIEPRDDPNIRPSTSTRSVYLGQWDYVMKHIRKTIPVFPQSILFKNMLILATLSGLLYNAIREHTLAMISWKFVLYLIISFIVIFLTRRLKFKIWKTFLVLSFCLLVLLQPFYIWVLITPIAVVFLYLVWFLIRQMCYSFLIWRYEKIRGTITSIENENGMRGIGIQKNILLTQLFMICPSCVGDKRIYFNEQFFKCFVMSDEWRKIGEK